MTKAMGDCVESNTHVAGKWLILDQLAETVCCRDKNHTASRWQGKLTFTKNKQQMSQQSQTTISLHTVIFHDDFSSMTIWSSSSQVCTQNDLSKLAILTTNFPREFLHIKESTKLEKLAQKFQRWLRAVFLRSWKVEIINEDNRL